MGEQGATLVAARFASSEALCRGINALRDKGYVNLDAWLPFPDEAVEEALALPASNIARWSAASGCVGAVAAYAVMWWTNVVNYPVVVGGFSPHAPIAFLPVTFESAILFAVLGAVGAFFMKAGLPRWYRPGFAARDIERATGDGFFLLVDTAQDIAACEADVKALHPESVQRVQA